jgi:hypothetical protein
LSILVPIDIKRALPSVSWHGNVEVALLEVEANPDILASAGVSGPILLEGMQMLA